MKHTSVPLLLIRTGHLSIALITIAVLAACGCSGATALENIAWELESLGGNAVLAGTTITLEFSDDQISGSAGCNRYGGSYRAGENSLTVSELFWTEMGCLEPEGILDQEIAYLNALDSVASHRVDASRLEMYDEAGTQLLVFCLQKTALPGPTETTPDQTEPSVAQESGLVASVQAPESLARGSAVTVRFRLTNTLSEGFFVLKWFTPFEGLAGDIFLVEREGVELPYRGKMVKRGSPLSEDYVWIEAGGSISIEVDLAEGYDFSQAGQYTLQFRSPRLSHTAKTSAEQAASLDELAMIQVPSNPVAVTVE